MAKNKWHGILITEHNVDEYLSDLVGTKSRHITQGVSFSKTDATQMNLLRLALIKHSSFSGLVKFLLYEYFKNQPVDFEVHPLDEEVIRYKIGKQERDKKKAKEIREHKEKEPSIADENPTLEIDSTQPVVELEEKEAGEIEPVKKRANQRGKFSNVLKKKEDN